MDEFFKIMFVFALRRTLSNESEALWQFEMIFHSNVYSMFFFSFAKWFPHQMNDVQRIHNTRVNRFSLCCRSEARAGKGQYKWPHQLKRHWMRKTNEYNFIANALDRFQAPWIPSRPPNPSQNGLKIEYAHTHTHMCGHCSLDCIKLEEVILFYRTMRCRQKRNKKSTVPKSLPFKFNNANGRIPKI